MEWLLVGLLLGMFFGVIFGILDDDPGTGLVAGLVTFSIYNFMYAVLSLLEV